MEDRNEPDGRLRPGRLTTTDIDRLLCCAPTPRSRAVVLIAFQIGTRAGEMTSLRWDDVDFGPAR